MKHWHTSTFLIVESGGLSFANVNSFLRAHHIPVVEAGCDSESLKSRLQPGRGLTMIRATSGIDQADGVQLARRIRELDRDAAILLIVERSSEEKLLAALRAGVNDYFKEPFSRAELIDAVHKGVLAPGRAASSGDNMRNRGSLPELVDGWRMIGKSPAVREVKAAIQNVAYTDSTVLITGETGTGKELVAELIHKNNSRREGPFVCVNCAAVPESLLESELFGYEKGAFTGADTPQKGKLELANSGTVFLDEIGDMSLCAQAKVLRILENKEFYRLGGRGTIPVNIRIIAATHQSLEELVQQGRFRKDVYFRLNVARIVLPPLRDRKEDIPEVAGHYINHFNRLFHRQVEAFDEEVLQKLLVYNWPGNIRELKNFIEAAFVNRPGGIISLADLPQFSRALLNDFADPASNERDKLILALSATRWNKSKAAEKLQWSRMTLYRKIAKYHLVSSNTNGNSEEESSAQPVRHDVTSMTAM